MIDETLLGSVQVGEDNKKAYCVKSFDEKDDDAKALIRQNHWTQGSVVQQRNSMRV